MWAWATFIVARLRWPASTRSATFARSPADPTAAACAEWCILRPQRVVHSHLDSIFEFQTIERISRDGLPAKKNLDFSNNFYAGLCLHVKNQQLHYHPENPKFLKVATEKFSIVKVTPGLE